MRISDHDEIQYSLNVVRMGSHDTKVGIKAICHYYGIGFYSGLVIKVIRQNK